MAVIGIDLGGTKIIGAIFNNKGEIINTTSQLLDKREGLEVGNLVLETIDILRKSSAETSKELQAVGICVPGIADSRTERVWAPNMPGWDNYPLKEEIQLHLQDNAVRVDVESDRTCYILGEVWKGAAMGCENAIYLAVGTGVGAGLFVDGRIMHGMADIAGCAGWMALGEDEYDNNGATGFMESYASGTGIANYARALMSKEELVNESPLYNYDIKMITTHEIFDAYWSGDRLASKVVDKALNIWGKTAANLVSLFNPEKIIWGGGVFGPAVQILDNIYAEALKWGQPISMKEVKFVGAALNGQSALYGAGYLALLSIKDHK